MASIFDIRQVLGEALPEIGIVDVGASPIAGERPFYQGLRDLGIARVVGFEPDRVACAKLNASAHAGDRFIPAAVGDGTTGEFRVCSSPYTSSLLEPNHGLLGLFQNLAELCRVVHREPVTTRTLDSIPEVGSCDFLKLDVQGAELLVLRGAERLLDGVVVIQTEVEFVPLYEQQPLFADVDTFLRGRGFLLHRFLGVAGRPFRPFMRAGNPNLAISQALWSDVVFVRDFTRLDLCAPSQLLKLAIILHAVYGSVDLAHLALGEFDRRCGTAHAPRYLERFGAKS